MRGLININIMAKIKHISAIQINLSEYSLLLAFFHSGLGYRSILEDLVAGTVKLYTYGLIQTVVSVIYALTE